MPNLPGLEYGVMHKGFGLGLWKWMVTAKSGFFSLVLYSLLFGPLGVAIVIATFFHELGHYMACRLLDVPASPPVFIPLWGAFVEHAWTDPDKEVFIAAAGPLGGALAGIPLLIVYPKAAAWNGVIQLLNLLPVPPLDGSKVLRGLWMPSPIAWIGVAMAVMAATISLACILLGWSWDREVAFPSPKPTLPTNI
ncbi:site-2 protease family protein [Methanopyrus sp.]